jgi:hypothetical protein
VAYVEQDAVRVKGVAPFRIHDVRHTHVSWLIAGGLPLPNIQARLGHESITTTIDTYGHLMPVGNELASQIIDTALRGDEIHPAPAMMLIPGGKAATESEALVAPGADTGDSRSVRRFAGLPTYNWAHDREPG